MLTKKKKMKNTSLPAMTLMVQIKIIVLQTVITLKDVSFGCKRSVLYVFINRRGRCRLLSCHVLDGSRRCQYCFNTLIGYMWKDLFQSDTSIIWRKEIVSSWNSIWGKKKKRTVLNLNPYLAKWKHSFQTQMKDYFLLQMDISWFGIDFFI